MQFIIGLILVVFFNILIIKTIKETSNIVTKQTLKMQLTFYRAALIESLFVLAFILIPTCNELIIAIFGITDPKLLIIGFNVHIVSAPISYILKMALTRPYRRFFAKFITRKNESIVETTHMQPITAIKNNFV